MSLIHTGREFNRDSMARWYAQSHIETDPAILSVHYLPENSGPREIRLVEVNRLMGDRNDDSLEPIDFGVDAGMDTEHRLFVLDVTPEQWDRICSRSLELPVNWTLDGAIQYNNE